MEEKVITLPQDEAAFDDVRDKEGTAELAIDPAKEKALLRKLDLFFTPVIMLVYVSPRTTIPHIVANWNHSSPVF